MLLAIINAGCSMRTEGYIDNDGIQIHYIRISQSESGGMAVVFIPGMLESAETYAPHFETTSISDVILVSLRGRGKSDAPERGYSFQEQLSDVFAVIRQLELQRCVLIGYSVGAAFAIAAALSFPEQVCGLGIIDYPPHYPAIPESWIEEITRPGRPFFPLHVAQAIAAEGERVVLSRELAEIRCPVLVVKGALEGSLLPAEIAQLYRERIPDCTMLVLEGIAHDPFSSPVFMPALVRFVEVAAGPSDRLAHQR